MDPSLIVTPAQMLYRILKQVGVTKQEQQRRFKESNVKEFRSHYGIHPNHAAAVWKDLFTTAIPSARVNEEEAYLQHFFGV